MKRRHNTPQAPASGKLALWISGRLRRGSVSGRTGAILAIAGVALTVMVMEFTLAVVVGFKHGILERLEGYEPQVSVGPPFRPYSDQQEPALTLSPTLAEIIGGAAPEGAVIEGAWRQPGILKTDNDFQGVVFMAREGAMPFERSLAVQGQWPDFEAEENANAIVMGEQLAAMLRLDIGDRIFASFIIDGQVKMRRLTVAALVRSDFADYDRTVVYVSPALLRSVMGLQPDQYSRIEIRGLRRSDAEATAAALQDALVLALTTGRLEQFHPVDSIARSGAMYLNWLALLDTNVVVIFVLMFAVGAFTLISSLFILILDHVDTIGVLRAAGASGPLLRSVFVGAGMRKVIAGMIIGNVLALTLLSIQALWAPVPLDPEMYYLASVPVEIVPWQFATLNAGILLGAWLILTIPARTAAKVDPTKSLSFD